MKDEDAQRQADMLLATVHATQCLLIAIAPKLTTAQRNSFKARLKVTQELALAGAVSEAYFETLQAVGEDLLGKTS